MKNIYAKRASDGAIVNISSTNVLPVGCERFYDDIYWQSHESGCAKYKIENGTVKERTSAELEQDAVYKSWWNAKIETQLRDLDIKRIRPVAEISDDNTGSSDKQAAKAVIKSLNEQAAALRAQILK